MPYIPPDFDEDSSDWNQGEYPLDEMASLAGWDTWADALVDPTTVTNPDAFRPSGYETPQDALNQYRDEISILTYLSLYWDEETELWYAVVDY